MIETVGIEKKRMTFEEYLDFEEKSTVKHEFHNGKLTKMSGGTFNHSNIAGIIVTLLNNFILSSGIDCYVLNSDMKIYFQDLNKSVYPDAAVVAGEPQFKDNKKRAIINPLVIVEVLSESSEKQDRTTKFEDYRTLPSLREYILVAQEESLVEAYYLHDPENDLWKITRARGLDASIFLYSIECTLQLKDIYRKIKFEKA